ncbi:MAG: PEP-CTERM sorting domain-containing protein [Chlamydiota bacterium]|nr:PEP-CTERM sorting domain-containing protein [Chlamydiota bacterium]
MKKLILLVILSMIPISVMAVPYNDSFRLDLIQSDVDTVTKTYTFDNPTQSLENNPDWSSMVGLSNHVFGDTAIFEASQSVEVKESVLVTDYQYSGLFTDGTSSGSLIAIWKKPDYALSGNESLSLKIEEMEFSTNDRVQLLYTTKHGVSGFVFVDEDSGPPISVAFADYGSLGDYFGMALDVQSDGTVEAYYAPSLFGPDPITSLDLSMTAVWTMMSDSSMIYESTFHNYSAKVEATFNPEPSTMLLFSSFIGGLYWRRRRNVHAV